MHVVSKAHAAVRGWGEGGGPPKQVAHPASRISQYLARLATTTHLRKPPKRKILLDSRGYQPFYELGLPLVARHKDFLKPSSKALLLSWSLPRLPCRSCSQRVHTTTSSFSTPQIPPSSDSSLILLFLFDLNKAVTILLVLMSRT